MIISNATPLMAFAKIDQLSLFQKIVKKVVIPTAVAQEISNYSLLLEAMVQPGIYYNQRFIKAVLQQVGE